MATAALLTGLAAVVSGRDAVVSVLTPPLIEGAGAVESPVRPGENVLVTWSIDKRTDCPGLTSRVWHGEEGFQLTEPVQITALPKGQAIYHIQTLVPTMAPPGHLTLKIKGHFECPGAAPVAFALAPVHMEVEG
jgi:hypothetical protein